MRLVEVAPLSLSLAFRDLTGRWPYRDASIVSFLLLGLATGSPAVTALVR